MLLFLLFGCGVDRSNDGVDTTSGESDADADADADGDSDVDTDLAVQPSFCSDEDDAADDLAAAGSDASLPACVTRAVQCGDTVTGIVEGGGTTYGSADYATMSCVGPWGAVDADGPDRVFLLRLPPESHFDLVLESCDSLSLRTIFRGQITATSPDPNQVCLADANDICAAATSTSRYGAALFDRFGAPTRDSWHEIVIDSMDGSGGEFKLTVACD